jgi:geranylgeranyl diphosphate synthase type II
MDGAVHSPPPPWPPGQWIWELAEASGSQGGIGGQVEDLAAEGRPAAADSVEYIHLHKTAGLIRAAVRIGVIAGGAKEKEFEALTLYGGDLGLAFQIADDILDATSTTETLGKTAGSDSIQEKVTWVAVFGLDAARQKARALVDSAIAALAPLRRKAAALEALARFMVDRES